MNMRPFCADGGIAEVIERYRRMVFGIALTRLRNRTDADDVFQEVFMIYHRKQKVFHDEEHRKAWLIKTTLNCCQKISGSMWRKRTVPLEELSRGVYPFASGSENTVYAALCELPEIYRTVLHLFYFEDLSCDEIGRALKLRPGTVRMRLTRGREMMRDLLKGEYEFER